MESMANIADTRQAEDLDLPKNHPGLSDESYIRRRKMFFYLARDLRMRGIPSPMMTYTGEELALWTEIFTELNGLHDRAASELFLAGREALNLRADRIPQLGELAATLQRTTGFSIAPAEGLLPGRSYFDYWSDGIMPCTQFLRHPSQPAYTPEPDIIHDVVGHVPPLVDKHYSEIVRSFGQLSRIASDEAMEAIVRLYWFTIEFGMIEERGKLKILGAGILSSIGETKYVMDRKPEFRPFSIEEIINTPFDPTRMQDKLFVLPSLDAVDAAVQRFLKERRSELTGH